VSRSAEASVSPVAFFPSGRSLETFWITVRTQRLKCKVLGSDQESTCCRRCNLEIEEANLKSFGALAAERDEKL